MRNNPFLLNSWIRTPIDKTPPISQKMDTSMDVRFGREWVDRVHEFTDSLDPC